MNNTNDVRCTCNTCPGTSCTCGCQKQATASTCACGPQCQCGELCTCAKK